MAPDRDPATELEALYTEMALHSVEGLWRVDRRGPDVRPHLWKWDVIHRLVTESGRLVDIDRPGERRAIALVNPGSTTTNLGATHTLYTAIQLVRPGETARAHRHTPSALRFIIQGEGASTTVEGERIPMHEGDFVITPNWMWHEHHNGGDRDVVWLDGLDSPFVFALAAAIYESYPGDKQPETRQVDYTGRAYGLGNVRPVGEGARTDHAPLMIYRWPQVREALDKLAALGTANPFDDVAVEYVSGDGHALSTMACWMQMLRPGVHTQAHKHTHAPVYHVFRGQGFTVIDGQRFDWAQGDSFVVPPNAWHEHANVSSDEPAYLFSMNDLPVLEAFGLHREEPYTAGDGHQPVTSVFDPARPAGGAP